MLPYFIGIPILLVVAWACRFLHVVFPETDSARTVFSTFLFTLRNVIILSMLLAWCVSLHSRIVHVQVRKLMICVGALLAFWLFVRHCKFEYTMSYHDTLGRYIWYSYYIPMVMVPLLGVFIVDYIGKPEGYRSPRWMNYLYIPAGTGECGAADSGGHHPAAGADRGITGEKQPTGIHEPAAAAVWRKCG